MPEKIEKLKQSIAALESELAGLDTIDPETRRALETVLEEIGDALRRPDVDNLGRHPSVTGRLEAAAEQFEASHPSLAGLLNRVVTTLGQMGI